MCQVLKLINHSDDNAFLVNLFFVIQVEGPKSPEEMLVILQRVLEESSLILVAARLDAEERQNNMRLREEQDVAYRAALEADQAREGQRREEEEERLARVLCLMQEFCVEN